MMYEELYLITESGRERLDLNSPSDITMEYVNNLFNDLSKIEASHTYTFKLPCTANNKRLLDYADDVRHTSSLVKQKGVAEYIVDGVQLFNDANLYVSGFEEGFYQVVMTWGVIEGLKKISNNDRSLRELKGSTYTGTEETNYEQDDIFSGFSSGYIKYTDFVKPSTYNKNAQLQRVFYSNGKNLLTDGNVIMRQRWGMGVNNVFTTYFIGDLGFKFPLIRTSEQYSGVKNYNASDKLESIDLSIFDGLLPVMPAPYLINKIASTYGISFGFTNHDSLSKICVPLVSGKVSDALNMLNYHHIYLSKLKNYFLCYDKSRYSTTNSSMSVSSKMNATVPTQTIYGGDSCVIYMNDYNATPDYLPNSKTEVNGELYNYHNLFKGRYITPVLEGKLELSATIPSGSKFRLTEVPRLIVYTNDTTDILGYEDWADEIGSVEADVEFTGGRFDTDDTGQYFTAGKVKLAYYFSPEYGSERLKCSRISTQQSIIYLKLEEIEDFDFDEHISPIIQDTDGIKIYAFSDEYCNFSDKNVFKNLPDVSCMDFLKAMFYILGGSPNVNSDGSIGFYKYSAIADKIKVKDVYDWSDRVLVYDIDRISYGSDIVGTSSSLAQKNFLLMKNDELDSYGKPVADEPKDDKYKHSYGVIEVTAPELDEFSTFYQSPFYGAFSKHGDYGMVDTGGKTDTLHYQGKTQWKIDDAKPMLGVIKSQPVKAYTYDESTKVETEVTKDDIATIDIWQFPTDLKNSEEYGFMAKIFNNPCLVTEDMRLSPIDLAKLDYTKPIYIEKYNSMFVLKKLSFSPSTGISKVELLKIPTDAIS